MCPWGSDNSQPLLQVGQCGMGCKVDIQVLIQSLCQEEPSHPEVLHHIYPVNKHHDKSRS